jgi:hypothetical protein
MDNKLKQRLRALGDVDKVRVNENKLSNLIYRKNTIKGETFGIINESGKYFIKKSNKLNSEDSKDFEYIGGLKNKLQESYSSYNSALHRLNEKIKLINESTKEEFIEDKKEEKTEKETTSETKNTILEKLLSKIEKNEGKECDLYKDLESETKSMLNKETLSKDDIDDIKNILDDHDCLDEYSYLLKKKVKTSDKKEEPSTDKEEKKEEPLEEKLTKDAREEKLLNKLDKEKEDNNKPVQPAAPAQPSAPDMMGGDLPPVDDKPIDTNEPQFDLGGEEGESEESIDTTDSESDDEESESDDPANEALKLMGKITKNWGKLQSPDKDTAKNLFGQLITATKEEIGEMDDEEKTKIIKRIEKNGEKIEEGKNYTIPRVSINENVKNLVKKIVSEEINKFKGKL